MKKIKKEQAEQFATKAEAEAKIAEINAVHGYPRVEQGTRIGGGRHVETITTLTDDEPVQIAGGAWGVRAERLTRAGLDTKKVKECDVEYDEADPPA